MIGVEELGQLRVLDVVHQRLVELKVALQELLQRDLSLGHLRQQAAHVGQAALQRLDGRLAVRLVPVLGQLHGAEALTAVRA